MRRSHGRPFGALVALAAAGAFFHAAAFGQADAPLTLTEAVDRALLENPGLRAAGLEVDIARARRDQAALATPFAVSAEIENFAGTDTLTGFGASETTLAFAKVLELGDKRALRAELGGDRVALAEAGVMLARVDVAAEAARRFVDVVVGQQRLELARAAIDVANETLAVVRRRVDVGRGSDAELASAEIALAEAELDAAALERLSASDRVSLASLWAEATPDFGVAVADLLALPPVEPFATMRSSLEDNPDLAYLVGEQRVLEAERRVAQARRRADLSLGFGVRYLAAPGDAGLVVSVSMPVGARSRAAPAVAEAAARLARQPDVIEQRRLELTALLFELHQQATLARERYTAIRDTLLPRAERAVGLYQRGFELGSYSLLEVTQAQRALLALRDDALTAAATYHLTLVDVEQLLGGADRPGDTQ